MVSATRTPTSSAPSQDGVVDYAPAFLPPASSSLTHTSRMDGFCNQNAYQLDSLAGLSFPAVYVGVVDCAPAFLPPASSSPQSSLPTSCLSTAARSSCRLEAAYCNCRRCRLARTRTEKPVRTPRGSGRLGCSRLSRLPPIAPGSPHPTSQFPTIVLPMFGARHRTLSPIRSLLPADAGVCASRSSCGTSDNHLP
jgi:hypothetical protein